MDNQTNRITDRNFKLGFDDSNKLPSYVAIYEALRKYENAVEDAVKNNQTGDNQMTKVENFAEIEMREITKQAIEQNTYVCGADGKLCGLPREAYRSLAKNANGTQTGKSKRNIKNNFLFRLNFSIFFW